MDPTLASSRSTDAPQSCDERSQPFSADVETCDGEVQPRTSLREFAISLLSGEQHVVALRADEDLMDLQAAIQHKFSIPLAQQVLLYQLQELGSLDAFAPGDQTPLLLLQNATQDAQHLEWLMEVEVAGSAGAADWLQQAPAKAREDFAVVARVVTLSPEAFEHAPWEFRANKELALRAVQAQGYLLMYATPEVQGDRDVVLAAVRSSGSALQYASPSLVKDREVVLAAVAENGNALRFASPELRADRPLVLAAVSRHGAALQVAAQALKADRELVLVAVASNSAALSSASAELRADDEVLQAAALAGRGEGGQEAGGHRRPVLSLAEIAKAQLQQLEPDKPKRVRKRDDIVRAFLGMFGGSREAGPLVQRAD